MLISKKFQLLGLTQENPKIASIQEIRLIPKFGQVMSIGYSTFLFIFSINPNFPFIH